jgi:ComF family protein
MRFNSGMDSPTANARRSRRSDAFAAALARRFARAGALLLDWMLPTVCAGCERPLPAGIVDGGVPRGWCGGCAAGLPGRDAPRCPVCGERCRPAAVTASAAAPGATATSDPTVPHRCTARCARCRNTPPTFDRTIVLADYAPPLDHLVQAIKFGRQSALAAPLGRLLAQAASAQWSADPSLRPDAIAVVPLAPARLAGRGFNQAQLLAAPIARALGIRTDTRLLSRIRQGAPASSLGAAQRRGALDHAFAAHLVREGAAVLVVDDVMTTGATLDAAAVALKAAGAGLVINCVAARTPPPAEVRDTPGNAACDGTGPDPEC